MAKYRDALPQLAGGFFITDGGLETTLIFLQGQELPHFAAFDLLKTPEGTEELRKYFRPYAEIAAKFNTGLVLETATWRANRDWGRKLGYGAETLAAANVEAVGMIEEFRREFERPGAPVVISGCLGPRGDGYVAGAEMSATQAEDYHGEQIETFSKTEADLVTAITMNYLDEAIGITQAARCAKMPVVISFTVETDGRLPTGQSLGDAIKQVDEATSAYPTYYMINCAHPSHFESAVSTDEPWITRLHGLRANASKLSHAELNEAAELDIGNPAELGQDYANLVKGPLKQLNVMGGCCGTDYRHIEKIASSCLPLFERLK